ncbi:hypothetical protein HH214_14135 [Mucilaginibacter robiniae]|uniref:HNH endonuclease n=1 Tax=Mucilaginibacter robiniae TaxID=2728022 RepID=A0A7L5E2Z4_9SPHI|nr:hypothetical protein [Mucilaginibacter robiniae]QJD96928.1 hypothetical protein HH214_14135 [Mucilaginibacter robiniae]
MNDLNLLYASINPKFIKRTSKLFKQLVTFNPAEVYARINIEKFKRRQKLDIKELFPNTTTGYCACGCGMKLLGRQSRWASRKCSDFPRHVQLILCGDSQLIKKIMMCYLPYECCKCHCKNYIISTAKSKVDGIQVDHVIAVKNGGGGCWLGNYQFICHTCHAKKTVIDNQIRSMQSAMPVSIAFD